MYYSVLANLRSMVTRVEREQHFEETMKKSFIRPAEQPTIDEGANLSSLLKSMMQLPSDSSGGSDKSMKH